MEEQHVGSWRYRNGLTSAITLPASREISSFQRRRKGNSHAVAAVSCKHLASISQTSFRWHLHREAGGSGLSICFPEQRALTPNGTSGSPPPLSRLLWKRESRCGLLYLNQGPGCLSLWENNSKLPLIHQKLLNRSHPPCPPGQVQS